ncbi:MAG: diguanylate cyclase [Sedimenticola sp.]
MNNNHLTGIVNGEKKNTVFPQQGEHARIVRAGLILVFLWTLVIALSLGWILYEEHQKTLSNALTQARAAFEKDLLFRRWNAGHGGVYVPITEITAPNPHLEVEEQNITTPSGRQLTLVNPAYMTRQVHELQNLTLGVKGHITSLNPIRPENAPDDWERKALSAFEQGIEEVSSEEQISGQPYLRMMRPLTTEKVCLKCHEKQGYKLGDIRGGISVAVPLAPLLETEYEHRAIEITAHALIWLLGIIGIYIGRNRILSGLEAEERFALALAESENAYRTLAGNIPGIIFRIDLLANGRMLFFNDMLETITGYSRNELGRGEFYALDPLIHPDDREKIIETIRHALEQNEGYEAEYRLRRKDGMLAHLLERGNPRVDETNRPLYIDGVILDITERKQAQSLIEHQATYDILTDLPNRRTLTDRLKMAIAQSRRHDHFGAVLFMDLDYFKQVNDSFGHGTGDGLLQEVAKRLRKSVRKEDTAARLSGDEFVVLLNELSGDQQSSLEQARFVARKISQSIAEPFSIQGHEIKTSISIGIALFPTDGESEEVILNYADNAMYQAKTDGRNTIRVFEK